MSKKILVADDSVTIQKIVAMAFEKEDAIVEGVSNGNDALKKIERFQPNIVLADVDMPGLTGFELSKKIKTDSRFDSMKILLLASDFEDFDEDLFKDSGADDHISKPFKSDDIIKKVSDLLLTNNSASLGKTTKLESNIDRVVKPEETAIELSTDNLIEEETAIELSADNLIEEETTIELSADNLIEEETAIELSTDNLIEEVDATIQPTSANLAVSFVPKNSELSSDKTATAEAEEDVLNEMIKDVESLKESTGLAETDSENNEFGETGPTREDEIGDELDTTFQEIVKFGSGKNPANPPDLTREQINNSLDVDVIIPEPENLLEKMTPSALTGKQGASGPNLIQDSLSYFSQISHESNIRQTISEHPTDQPKNLPPSTNAEIDPVVGEQVKEIIKDSLNTTLGKEIAELSNSINHSIREIVREITPKIAREIIKEEIDKIKKS